jgi:hypothetical protein
MVQRLSFSMPLLALTMGMPGLSSGPTRWHMSRITWLGTTSVTSSAPSSASSSESVARTSAGSSNSAWYRWFRCAVLMLSTTSGSRAQMTVSPLFARTVARAVPQLPPPMTALRMPRV